MVKEIFAKFNGLTLPIILLAGFSFYLTLFLPSVGEEGVYTNITLEMIYNKDYLVPTLYGAQYHRPPLFNWLMLFFTPFFGPTNIVIVARLVNMFVTFATAGLLAWFVNYTLKNKNLALLTTAIYLSGDLLFKRGWLAYADSLFALCIFASIVCLWLALEKQQRRWFWAAGISLCLGFLAKTHTAYLFYAVSALVLLFLHPNRKFIFSITSWVVHLLAIIFPIVWTLYVNKGHGGVGTTWQHSLTFFAWPGAVAYFKRVTINYPVELIVSFLPASIIALFAAGKLRTQNFVVKVVFWIVVLNLLPYWLVPTSNIRYILPLYPLIALLIGYSIWHAGQSFRRIALYSLLITVIAKYIFSIWWLPYEYSVYRGDAGAIAADVLERTNGENLYINDTSSTGLRVAVEINKLRANSAPISRPPHDYVGYLLSDTNDLVQTSEIYQYDLRNNKLYLLFKASSS